MKYVILTGLLFAGILQNVHASHIYEVTVIDSPGVHKLTDQIPFDLIVTAKYDLSKFGVKVRLDTKTFDWDGTRDSESAVVKKILREQFHILPELQKLYDRLGNGYESTFNACLGDAVRLYQTIEAEGVFYRDLIRQMDKRHERLKEDPDYEASRINNYRIVNGFFNIVEDLVKDILSPFTLWNSTAIGRRNPADKLAEYFKTTVYKGHNNERGILDKTKEKLNALRQQCHLPFSADASLVLNYNKNDMTSNQILK